MNAKRKKTLESLHRGIMQCLKCRLARERKHAVPGEGPPDAKIIFIGEAPGEKEDLAGKPFRGRSGEFLDRLFETAGIRRGDVYITSSVKCRPPANRDPKPDELETCRQAWLLPQIEILQPRLIVLLGKVALRQILNETGPLRKFHGRAVQWRGRLVLPTYHPAAGMRFPDIRTAMKQDFGFIRPALHDPEKEDGG